MTDKTNEELRVEWNTAVADANQAIDLLQVAKDIEEPDTEYVKECEAQLHRAEEKADLAYRAYVQQTSNWVTDAPRRFDVVMVASTIQTDTEVIPSITFAFRAASLGEPITVTYANTELELRRFQKDFSKSVDEAIRRSRELGRD